MFTTIALLALSIHPEVGDRTTEILDQLSSCPTIQEVAGESDYVKRHRVTTGVTEVMWKFLGTSTTEIRGALEEALRERQRADTLLTNRFNLSLFRKEFPRSSPRKRGESDKQYAARLTLLARRAAGSQIWVDRYLFDPPVVDPNGKVGARISLIRDPMAGSLYDFGPQYPVGVEEAYAGVSYPLKPSDLREPKDLAEFDYFAAHFPRRQVNLVPPKVEFTKYRKEIEILASCPSPGTDWMVAHSEGTRPKVFAQVVASMRKLQGSSNERIRGAINWLWRRYMYLDRLLGTGHITPEHYFKNFPLDRAVPDDKVTTFYIGHLRNSAREVAFNEMWVDRFLFIVPKSETVKVLKNVRYPWLSKPTIWYVTGDYVESGSPINRLAPLTQEGGTFGYDENFVMIHWTGDFDFPYGKEFAYYSSHYARRKVRFLTCETS